MINAKYKYALVLKLPVTCTTIAGLAGAEVISVGLNDPVAMPTNNMLKYITGTAWVATTSASYGDTLLAYTPGILSGQPLTDMVNVTAVIAEVYSYPYNFTKYRAVTTNVLTGLKYPNGQMGSEIGWVGQATFKVVKGDESLVSIEWNGDKTEGTVRVVAHPESPGLNQRYGFVLEEADLQDADVLIGDTLAIGPSNETLYAAISTWSGKKNVFYNRMKVEDLLKETLTNRNTQIKITADGVTGLAVKMTDIIWSTPKDIRGTEMAIYQPSKDVLLAAVNAQNSRTTRK
ncbi:hypothetical protein SPFM1_00146 [Salmonella phage SPFM1]|nr:hypothetical protein SPFM1_00146 [Salmonella phage SPFM1]